MAPSEEKLKTMPYGQIARRTWRRDNFRALSPLEKLILLYIWSCPDSLSACPLFHFNRQVFVQDTGVNLSFLYRTMKKLSENGWFVQNSDSCTLYLNNQVRLFPPANGSWLIGWLKCLESFPETEPLLGNFIDDLVLFARTKDEKWLIQCRPLLEEWVHRVNDRPRYRVGDGAEHLYLYTQNKKLSVKQYPPPTQTKTILQSIQTEDKKPEPIPDLEALAEEFRLDLRTVQQKWNVWKHNDGFRELLSEIQSKQS